MQTVINTHKETVTSVPQSVQRPITLSWILFIVFVATTTIYYFLAQPELPLFYTLANKQDQLASKEFIFLFPVISLVMNFVHFFIVRILKRYSTILLKLFVGTTLALQILLAYALLRIILITV